MISVTPLKILIVEDDKTVALHHCRQLENLGHRTYHAENGIEAIKALSNYYFDLVLMDIQMPVMDGIETTRRIRQSDEDYADIPIFGVSANPTPPADTECREAGMNHFIPKPLSVETFEQVYWQARSKEIFSHLS